MFIRKQKLGTLVQDLAVQILLKSIFKTFAVWKFGVYTFSIVIYKTEVKISPQNMFPLEFSVDTYDFNNVCIS